MTNRPDITGRVFAIAAIDFIDADGIPYFTFSLYLKGAPPEKQHQVLYFDLNKQGAQAVVSIVCASYSVQTDLDVFLESPKKAMRVKFVQASKPPKSQ